LDHDDETGYAPETHRSRAEASFHRYLLEELIDVARCEVCGNDYDKAMEITVAGSRHVFDSFECAIRAIAPRCEHCDCTVIGHGVEADGHFFCCAHCARENGVDTLTDRVGPAVA
jgi:hypothetical protein